MAYAPQLTNIGKRGQDARYSIAGLPQVAPGVYSDGTYQYDANGLDLSGRKAENIPGLRGADENYVDGVMSIAGAGGGVGGGGFAPSGVYGYDVQKAKLAYDRAVAASNEGIANLNKQIGMTRIGDKAQIDPYNEYGALRMLLGQQGGQLNDAYDAASERHIGHRGLGNQGISQLRNVHGAQVADMGNQYNMAYKQWLQSKADAQAEYELAQQMAAYMAMQDGSYWYGGGDGGGSADDIAGLNDGFQVLPNGDLNMAGLNINSVVGDNARNEHLDMVRRAHAQSIAQASKPKKKTAKLPMGAIRTG